jgi:hypothetical protein
MANARQLLDQERKQFTEAAIRMGVERDKLYKEKQLLEEEKRLFETQKLLQQMPEE